MDKADNKNYKMSEKALYDYKFLLRYIELRKKDIEELDYQGVSAAVLSLAKSDNRTISDPVSNEFFDVEKIKNTWTKEIKKNEIKINKIDRALDLLNEVERKIIEMRYFECIRVYIIADELGYCDKQVSRIKKNAINKISIVLFGGLNRNYTIN